MLHLLALAAGFVLDCAIGDPPRAPHLVRLIGGVIASVERILRRTFPKSPKGERAAGYVLVIVVIAVFCTATAGLAGLLWRTCVPLGFACEALLCHQMIAARQLEVEAMRVVGALREHGLDEARRALSWIVGRDTEALDEDGVLRATVETVAENASDGAFAPILFLGIAGPVGGIAYKCVNTMDSMVGYKDERHLHFGRAAARLDDLLNWVPARMCGYSFCALAPTLGLDGKGALATMHADAAKSSSPNAGWPEAACAGALGIRLLGPATYFGKRVEKPWIGPDTRRIRRSDVACACRLMRASSLCALALALALRALVLVFWSGL